MPISVHNFIVHIYIFDMIIYLVAIPGGSVVKNPPAMQEMQVGSLGREYSLEKEMTTHSSILAW